MAALVCLVFYLMTKSGFGAAAIFVAAEGALTVVFIVNSTAFEGAFGDMMEKLSLFEQFYRFVDGVFDVRGIVYFLSVVGVFLFLSVQSMEKRRWSE